jgi:hypothetical protein
MATPATSDLCGLSCEFEVVEKVLAKNFLPSLFGNGESCDNERQLACFPVKRAGLALPNPMTVAESNWNASTSIFGHPFAALRGTTCFRSADHSAAMQSRKAKLQKRNRVAHNEMLETLLFMPNDRGKESNNLQRKRDVCMALGLPMVLCSQEIQNALSMRHAETLHNLTDKCDGCDAHFPLQHALGCKKRGLMIVGHNEI